MMKESCSFKNSILHECFLFQIAESINYMIFGLTDIYNDLSNQFKIAFNFLLCFNSALHHFFINGINIDTIRLRCL